MATYHRNVLALAGGVGGAKLALGLARLLGPKQLTVVVNTGDDEEFHGLHVSPDLDTMLYTLAGISNPETGWGLAGESFNALAMLARYGAETWFNLGDRDLATHIRRTQLMREGSSLSQVTAEFCERLGVAHSIVPMSDGPVRTFLETDLGRLSMQEYFVRHHSEPAVKSVRYRGAEDAVPSPGFDRAMGGAGLAVLCPSNPLLSTGPILALPGVRQRLADLQDCLRVAVSPLVGGEAVRGPAARIMRELGHEATSLGIARMYADIIDVLVIDVQDADLATAIGDLGLKAVVAPTIMNSEDEKVALARLILEL